MGRETRPDLTIVGWTKNPKPGHREKGGGCKPNYNKPDISIYIDIYIYIYIYIQKV